MPTQGRVAQDRRHVSRLLALLGCEFTFGQDTHKAVVVDLSLRGALLSADFLPPEGGQVRVFLRAPRCEEPMALDGFVVRSGWGMFESGQVSRFGVHFNSSPTEMISLMHSLLPNRKK